MSIVLDALVIFLSQNRNCGVSCRDAETWTEAGFVRAVWDSDRQPPPWRQIEAGWYDQTAFVTAVTSAVNQITAKRNTDPQPLLQPCPPGKTALECRV